MSFKTIIAHCDGSKSVFHRLVVATDIGRRFDAMLTGIYAKAPFEPPSFVVQAFDMATLFKAHEQGVAADEAAARAAFHEVLEGRHSMAEWWSHEGYAEEVLARYARYADLVVVGQSGSNGAPAVSGDLPGTVAIESGRPVLVVPYVGARNPIGETVMLCWNASRESARAAADALPFLKTARNVIALIIEPSASGNSRGAGADIVAWLARHGVNVMVRHDMAPNVDVGEIILSRAADYDADLIVMGVYGHSRRREMVLGGVSRTMLASMTVPLLISH
jgi:nucleotide-binding universal stress UspA family protein